MSLIFVPKVVYGAGPTTINFIHPQKLWVPKAKPIGGAVVSEAGVPTAYTIRREQLVQLNLRFQEQEWAAVDDWLAFAQSGQPFDFYFDRNFSGNSFLWSQTFSNAAWAKTSCTVALTTATAAPDGTMTAFKIIENATGPIFPGISQTLTGSTDNMQQTISWFVKAAERTWCYMDMFLKDGTQRIAVFNLLTGEWGNTSAGITAKVAEYYGNGWWRIGESANILSGGGLNRGDIRPNLGSAANSYTGDGVSGIYVWGGQWGKDVNSFERYVPTQGVANFTKFTCYLDSPTLGDGDVDPSRESYTRLYTLPVTLRTTNAGIVDMRIHL